MQYNEDLLMSTVITVINTIRTKEYLYSVTEKVDDFAFRFELHNEGSSPSSDAVEITMSIDEARRYLSTHIINTNKLIIPKNTIYKFNHLSLYNKLFKVKKEFTHVHAIYKIIKSHTKKRATEKSTIWLYRNNHDLSG